MLRRGLDRNNPSLTFSSFDMHRRPDSVPLQMSLELEGQQSYKNKTSCYTIVGSLKNVRERDFHTIRYQNEIQFDLVAELSAISAAFQTTDTSYRLLYEGR